MNPFFWRNYTIISQYHSNSPSITILIIRRNIIWFLWNFSINCLLNKFRLFRNISHWIIVPFIRNWRFVIFKTIRYSMSSFVFNIWIIKPLLWRNNIISKKIYNYCISIHVFQFRFMFPILRRNNTLLS